MQSPPHAAAAKLIEALRAPEGAPLPPLPATAVVVAHPDDEVVGCGSRLPRLATAHFVYVTDGAPRNGDDAGTHGLSVQQYAHARKQERDAALRLCGIAPQQALDLAFTDQEAALHLVELSRRLADLFAQWGTEAVIAHPYEGGHPDHDASAFGVHAAVALLRQRGAAAPAIVEMSCYHEGDGARHLATNEFLDLAPGQVDVDLTPAQQQRRRALIDAHVTQRRTLAIFYNVTREGWRPAPAYDFTRRPHEGQLWYERHGWAIDGDRVCAEARAALAELGLEGPL